jgi:hypothetical protein
MHRAVSTRTTTEPRPGHTRRIEGSAAKRADGAGADEFIQARHEQMAELLSLAMLGRRRGPLD